MARLYRQTVSYFLFLLRYWKVTRKRWVIRNTYYPMTCQVTTGAMGRCSGPRGSWMRRAMSRGTSTSSPSLWARGSVSGRLWPRPSSSSSSPRCCSSTGSSQRGRGWGPLRSPSQGSPLCPSPTKWPSPTDLPKLYKSIKLCRVNDILYHVSVYISWPPAGRAW